MDFKYLSQVKISEGAGGPVLEITQHTIDSKVPADPHVEEIVDKFDKLLQEKMNKIIACNAQPLDARSDVLRSTESNVANFVCDIVAEELGTDCSLLVVSTLKF